MKKFFAIAAMAVACLTANAQQAAGTFSLQPKVGLTVGTTTAEGAKDRIGLTAGVEGMYQINNWFGLSAAVNYSQYGVKSENEKITFKFDYITVPILANFYVCHGLALKTGLEFDFNATKDVKFEGTGISYESDPKSTMITIPVGISYEFDCGIVLDTRINIGATKVFKEDIDGNQVAAMFTVGYKFGL